MRGHSLVAKWALNVISSSAEFLSGCIHDLVLDFVFIKIHFNLDAYV